MAPSVTLARIAVALATVAIVALVSAFAPQPDGEILALYSLTLIPLAASVRWVLLGLERARAVAFSRILGESVFALLVFFTVASASDLARVPVSQLIGDAAGTVFVFVVLIASGVRFPLRFRLAAVTPVFRRSWKLVASALLGLVIYNSGLLLLRFFRDTASVGYFAAAYTFVTFMLNLGGAYNQSLLPTLTRDRDGAGQLYGSALVHSFAVTLPVAVGGTIVAGSLVSAVFGADYAAAAGALRILMWTVPFALLREVATAGLMARGGERAVFRFTSLTAVASVVLNLALIPPLGLTGAAIAAVATESVRFLAALQLARSHGFLPAAATRFWKPIAASILMAAVLVVVPVGFPGKVAGGIVLYAVALAFLGGIRVRSAGGPEISL
jgi:O-antigen/teichoic acid export membrane protein